MTAAVEVKVSERRGVIKIPTPLSLIPPGVDAPLLQTGLNADRRGPPSPEMIAQRRAQAQAQLDRLARQLDLTDEQKAKVRDPGRQLGQRPGACGGLVHGGRIP